MTYISKSVRLSVIQSKRIKQLVKSGEYVTESEAIRQAIREFLERQMPKIILSRD